MNFCGHYKNKKNIQEIRQSYNQLGLVIKYMKEHPEKRLIVEVPNKDCDVVKLQQQCDILKEENINYTISTESFSLLNTLIEKGYNAFLDFPFTDYEIVDESIKIGVTDIWIDGPLAFDLPNINKILKDTNIKIRIKPNGTKNNLTFLTDIKSFFIRPEDLYLYKDYIDTIDFKELNNHREETLLSIYKRGNFDHQINYLINDLDCTILNSSIPEIFGKNRLECRQRCKSNPNSCHSCPLAINLAQSALNLLKDK